MQSSTDIRKTAAKLVLSEAPDCDFLCELVEQEFAT